MRAHFPIILLLFTLAPPALTGCAALGLKGFDLSKLGLGSPSDEQEVDEDPIATVAAHYRNPAQVNEDEESAPDHRSAPPREHLTLGMAMREVVAAWGDPSSIESAGDSREGNQRWSYYQGLSSRWGISAKRVVYFENGRVAGWKKN